MNVKLKTFTKTFTEVFGFHSIFWTIGPAVFAIGYAFYYYFLLKTK